MYLNVRFPMKRLLYLILFVNSLFLLFAQEEKTSILETEQEIKTEMISPAPAAVPVLTPEEAEIANQELIQAEKIKLEKQQNVMHVVEEWRQNYYLGFLKKMLLALLCGITISIIGSILCRRIEKKSIKKEDFAKAVVSLFCSIILLLLLFSAIPYFYNFWSVGNLLLGCIIWYLLFKYYNIIFIFSKKDIVLIPLFLMGTWIVLNYVSPHMRDIPNTIVLETEPCKYLLFYGVVSNSKEIKPEDDFLCQYNYIDLNEGWEQTGSYRASITRKKGKMTLSLPTELIQNYDLGIKLYSPDPVQGTLSINEGIDNQWQSSDKTFVLPLSDYSRLLYPDNINCPIFFFLLCIAGSLLLLFILERLLEKIYTLYYSDRQKALELALLVICVLFCIANLKNSFFIDNCDDLDEMAAKVPQSFTTKHPPMIYAWWRFCRFISPFESINTAFVFGTLIGFWGGMWLIGTYLIRCRQSLFAFLIILPCINLISATMYSKTLLVDQIVVSICVLIFGLFTRLIFAKKYSKIFLSIVLLLLIMVAVSVRLEGITYAVPICIVFASLTLFSKKQGLKRVFLSGLFGSVLAFSLLLCYQKIISPYVFHATKLSSMSNAAGHLYSEVLGICYFENNWDDLPDFFSDEAKAALDKTHYIARVRPYIKEYVHKNGFNAWENKEDADQVRVFWLHMIKKYPATAIKVKWVANQYLWYRRPYYTVPFNVSLENSSKKIGMSFGHFFKDGITSFGLVLPSWVPQLSLLFVFLFVGILLLKFNDPELWIVWGIGASGFLHNFAYLLVPGSGNYRYIFWADMSGGISFFLFLLVTNSFLEYKKKKISMIPLNNIKDNHDETLCSDSLFQ